MFTRVQIARKPIMAMSRRRSVVARAVVRSLRLPSQGEDVLEDVREIIIEQLGKPADEVTAESKFADLGADSLDTVEIMMALEEKFELELDEEGADKVATVKDAADMIAKAVADKA